MKIAFFIALGGGLGALSRYYLSKVMMNFFNTIYPIGTLTVNLLGAVLIGFFYGMLEKTIIPEELRIMISIGFLGAFTTFSTFALENINLFRDGEVKLALINILITNVVGILFVLVGILCAGLVIQR
ncbi:MAG: fluoride efflux transporter CrcB [Spirochaetales bacterium]|nr:fluoride efflux transporter CrcB [Spirochaetales bacterium]MCF7939419.1 fluoride efflux transporter CrcB [Spirochaetales bacterium]